ncbi:glycosyl transferase family 1 [archaeon]|nr:glycosyl transferase family 1 [archaeon]|tara:strand:- start:491 stop:1630 length:1140 start_codon:yes stop_codon:yes gene_type:complete
MRSVVLYAHPPEPDGLSLQGHFLYKGLLKNNYESWPCNPEGELQKEFWYKNFKPKVAYGIGYWGNVPLLVHDPLRYGITPVPWFNADGWVANYHDDLSKLPLMFTTSEWVRQTYKRDGVDVRKMVPMHIGIDTNNYKPINDENSKEKIKKLLGIKNNEKMILTVGGDVTSKGAQEMFKALAKVNEEFKDWKYVCKSWPSDCSHKWYEEESKLVEELGIKDNVIFIEGNFSTEFMPYLLNAVDIYAAPSRLEGFGMLQVEAMACGKPVISINHMGPSETIIHNKTGFLARVADKVSLEQEWVYPWMGFPEKQIIKFDQDKVFAYRADIDDLTNFTIRLLTEDNLRDEIGKNAREHAVKNFDYKYISRKIAEITKKKLNIE